MMIYKGVNFKKLVRIELTFLWLLQHHDDYQKFSENWFSKDKLLKASRLRSCSMEEFEDHFVPKVSQGYDW